MNAITRAVKAAGGLSKLAADLNVNPNVVGNWRIRKKAPAKYCLAIEEATGVTVHDLRPDVFGPAPDTKAA